MTDQGVWVDVEVPFHDVDVGGIVWHGHFYKYFELARTALMRACDLDVPVLARLGARVVVSETRCRHHAPLRYGDRVRVHAAFGVVGPGVEVRYEVRRDDGALAARGVTTLVTVAPDADRLLPTPDVVLERIARWTS